ncbi:MAG: aldehyde ferredoxin oxidoreductase family protein [Thermoprotei archaeon]
MYGWSGKILRINLSNNKVQTQTFDLEFALKYIGGRGFAAKILWDEVPPGTNPLSPDNKLIIASGPLTTIPMPSSGKMVVAAKSPLTGGYGDGNIGTMAAYHMRRAGYDALVIEGKAQKPTYIYVENDKVQLLPADDLWSLTTIETEEKLKKNHGTVGVISIGPAGENLVKFATIVSEGGRSGGRPGIGAVMGSKNLKSIAFKGTEDLPYYDKNLVNRLGTEGYKAVKQKPGYQFWMRQGTVATVEWAQANSVLPTYNFREGIFDDADNVNGYAMEKIKIRQKGCPSCNMICGMIIKGDVVAEIDYENVGMLGPNIGIGDYSKIAVLNKIADDLGMDTISLGSVIGFAMEASEKHLIDEKMEWGDSIAAIELAKDIAYRKGIGNLLAEGTRNAGKKLGHGAEDFAMHVKGLEISAYDCHAAPGMALAYGTSPIGAHHKDAWFISTEIQMGRFAVNKEKVEKLIWMQRIRGGIFETLVACRFPWVELGYEIENYPGYFKAATGIDMTLDDMFKVADRIYNLMRAYWIRETIASGGSWSREIDYPPARWFKEPLTKGPLKGVKLSYDDYNKMLSWYYEIRNWDEHGIPTKQALINSGLENVAQELSRYIKLR